MGGADPARAATSGEAAGTGELPPVVALWNARAAAYGELVERWPLFDALADRLVETALDALAGLGATARPRACDLAAGTGRVAERLLARAPDARVTLVEPAPAMLAAARARLGDRAAGTVQLPAERAGELAGTFDAFLCSAALHLCDEARVFRGVAARLAPGGVFAFNLWWHSFDETAELPDAGPADGWREALVAAFAERGHPPLELPEPRPVRRRTRRGLARDAAAAGLALELCAIDADEHARRFQAEFGARVHPRWRALPEAEREAVLARAGELCPGRFVARTVRVVLRREAASGGRS